MEKIPISLSHPHLAAEWDHEANGELLPSEVTRGSRKKISWVCDLGHRWISEVKSRALGGTKCPYCTHKWLLPGFNDFATSLPLVADEWSRKNENSPFSYWSSSDEVAWWTCSSCGYEWEQTIASRKTQYCFQCSHAAAGRARRESAARRGKSVAKDQDLFSLWSDKNNIDPNEVSIRSSYLAIWSLPCGHEAKTIVKDRRKSLYACSVCNFSFFEELVVDHLRTILPEENIIRNRRPLRTATGSLRELDIWLPDLKLAFEVQDFATHSRTEGEEGFLRGNRVVKKGPAYHEEKRSLAELQLGVRLIEVWEDQIQDGSFKSVVEDEVQRAQDGKS